MKLREITIKNFRNLVDITIPVDDTTILIGENNSGKTSLLEALRIAMTRSPSGREAPFSEYDYHMSRASDSPQTSEGIIIELWFREDKTDDWPVNLFQDLEEIIQTEPVNDIDSIGLRVSSKYDKKSKFVTRWEFLTLDGQVLEKYSKDSRILANFRNYLRFFYLNALRDSNIEFSQNSQYWGKLLRDLKIDEKKREELLSELEKLNDSLLKSDARIDKVKSSLEEIQKIIGPGEKEKTSIRALPFRPWDMMSKAEVVIKPSGSEVEFPLARHGQGIQSLGVLYLFDAYINVLLTTIHKKETEAILALEEPEAHLHPQAARTLAGNLSKIKSQKIISSHSPYFIQEIPFKQLRLFRRCGSFSRVFYIRQSCSVKLPPLPKLLGFCEHNSQKFSYDEKSSILTVKDKIEEKEYKTLEKFYRNDSQLLKN